MTNNISNEKKSYRFNDDATDNIILMEKNDKVVWINHIFVDQDNCKLFILLLKNAFDTVTEDGCTKYQQLTLKSEWDEFLKENKEWEIIKENNDGTLLIQCDTIIAPSLITDGFLRNNKSTY